MWDDIKLAKKLELWGEGDDKNLAAAFIVLFLRFEYALKRTGFLLNETPGERAEPNWDKYGVSCNDDFGRLLLADPDLAAARRFLLDDPPNKQIVDDYKQPDWTDEQKDSNKERLFELLRHVRFVRNNLMHGEKCGFGPRDLELVKRSLTILKACAGINPDVLAAIRSNNFLD